jgi:hypothetical protein
MAVGSANVSKRSFMLLNSVFRVSYSVGALLAPSKMIKVQLAPDIAERQRLDCSSLVSARTKLP